MGRFFGKRWKIDGVTAGPISRHYPANGRYSVIFERDDAFLEQIEKINWAKPTIQRLEKSRNRSQSWRALPLRRTARSRRRSPPSSRRKARLRARPPQFRSRQPPFRSCVKPALLLN